MKVICFLKRDIEKHNKPLHKIFAHYAEKNLYQRSPNQGGTLNWDMVNKAAHALSLSELQTFAREFKLLHLVSNGELKQIFNACRPEGVVEVTYMEFKNMLAQIAIHAYGDFPHMGANECACALLQHMDKQGPALNKAGMKRVLPLPNNPGVRRRPVFR